MFVGHALLAFAVVAGLAARVTDRDRALALGVVAAVYATIPDVDVAYALVGVARALGADPLAMAAAFWATGNVVHRAITHSIVLAPVVAGVAAAWVDGRRVARLGAAGVSAGVLAVVAATSGPLGAAVAAAFLLATFGVAEVVRERGDVGPGATFAAALFGIASHPVGDLFTGQPPQLLYPVGIEVVTHRVTLAPDPTLHLLAAFALELATAWAAVFVWAHLNERSVRELVDARAAVGAGYAASVLVIPAPTMELSYPFVFTVLAVSTVGFAPRVRLRARRIARPGPARATLTGLTAVTVAAAAYAAAYLAGVA